VNTSFPPSDENRQILEEASAWFVEFRLGEPDGATRRKFSSWLRRSPEHIRAYMEMSGAYARLPGPQWVRGADLDRLIARARTRSSIVSLNQTGLHEDLHPGRPRASARGRASFGRSPALLAGLAACILVGLGIAFFTHGTPVYETQIGEQRSITLEDGSRMELNAQTRVRIVFEAFRRRVDLVQGQAFFHVAKDPHRPFIVESGSAFVRAVGTQFDVYRRDTGTTVTVIEGRVALQSAAAELPDHPAQRSPAVSGSGVELSAGEQAVISAAVIAMAPRANVAAATAWTQGQLEFDETPLSEAVVQFNRYSRKPLVLGSTALATLKISGVYSSKDVASFLLFLRSQPDLTVTETDKDIRLTNK
jgi:transmembrane sensor